MTFEFSVQSCECVPVQRVAAARGNHVADRSQFAGMDRHGTGMQKIPFNTGLDRAAGADGRRRAASGRRKQGGASVLKALVLPLLLAVASVLPCRYCRGLRRAHTRRQGRREGAVQSLGRVTSSASRRTRAVTRNRRWKPTAMPPRTDRSAPPEARAHVCRGRRRGPQRLRGVQVSSARSPIRMSSRQPRGELHVRRAGGARKLLEARHSRSPVKANPVTAQEYYMRAAANYRNPNAQFEMGMMFLNGDGGMKASVRQAGRWLQLAAQKAMPVRRRRSETSCSRAARSSAASP